MGWINKGSGGGDFVRIELAEGESFEGRYTGPAEMNGTNGPFVSHQFEVDGDESGAVHTISGASLNRGLQGVEPGTLTRLTYDGMVITKSKRTCKAYTVGVFVEDEKPVAKSGKSF